MRKSTVLKAFAAVGALFLIFQLYNLIALIKRNATDQHEDQRAPVLLFAKVYQKLQIPFFILCPAVLEVLGQRGISQITDVNIQSSSIQVFGVKEDQWNHSQKASVFKELEDNFLVQYSKNEVFTEKESVTREEITHVLLTRGQTVIHIVVFYRRDPGFLWHDQISSVFQQQIRLYPEFRLVYGQEQGAFDMFELTKVTLGSLEFLIPTPVPAFLQQIPMSKFIECNHTSAAAFYGKHAVDDSPDGSKFRRKARQIIARAKQYLDDLGIQFWLSSGTCLGWYRQCDIITYSKDVDLGIWIKDYKDQLVPVFEHGGFYLKHIFGKVTDSFELSFMAGDIKLDLFFFYEEGDTMWNGGTDVDDGSKYKYIFPHFSLCWTVFLDMKIRVPCPTRPYVEANYGQNWFEPVTSWDWKASPPNVRPNGFWPKNEWDEVMQIL